MDKLQELLEEEHWIRKIQPNLLMINNNEESAFIIGGLVWVK